MIVQFVLCKPPWRCAGLSWVVPGGLDSRTISWCGVRQDILLHKMSAFNVMPTTDNTLDEILSLAAAHFKVPREKLTPDGDFFKTLGIDSLQALDLLTRLEHHFRIELPDYELQGVSDFRTLAQRIQARL